MKSEKFVGAAFCALIVAPIFLFLWFVMNEYYERIQLTRYGEHAEATVNSCKVVESHGREGTPYRSHWCQITYDDHVGDLKQDLSPGQRISVLYLPYNPSIVQLGDHGDSWWAISVKNDGWFGSLFLVVFGLFFVAGIGILFCVTAAESFRRLTSRVARYDPRRWSS